MVQYTDAKCTHNRVSICCLCKQTTNIIIHFTAIPLFKKNNLQMFVTLRDFSDEKRVFEIQTIEFFVVKNV